MRRQILVGVVFGVFLVSSVFAMPMTEIRYETAELGLGRWQYTYEVANIGLTEPIEEFTIWFDYELYDSLAVVTPDTPAGWDQIVWQPDEVLGDDGGYDAKALGVGIGQGSTIGGFSVSFDWLGTGEPGPQRYDIVDPANYPEPLDSGETIPEPGTIFLLCIGSLVLRKKII